MNKTTEERDALAAKYFPELWQAAQQKGKSAKRNQLRRAAEHQLIKENLKSRGASCSNCSSFGIAQIGGENKTICHADSDYYGYSLTCGHHICHKWTMRQPK